MRDEIIDGFRNGPHVVILGAGATMAAIPNGDKYGNRCSAMDDFIENMGLQDILHDCDIQTTSRNLETIFSELSERPECVDIKNALESQIWNKMGKLVIPDTPTAYDYLLLSLRYKDHVFSFNWDNLLIQSYQRLQSQFTVDLPQIHFLHGNVGISFCGDCRIVQPSQNPSCVKCNGPLSTPGLLFPVKQKDYSADPYIAGAWSCFLKALEDAKLLTIFGYSAPSTDQEAVKMMQKAFSQTLKALSTIEVIDIADRSVVSDKWSSFSRPVNYHIEINSSIFDSLLAKYPRRTTEGYSEVFLEGRWAESAVTMKESSSMEELFEQYKPLLDREDEGDFSFVSN